MNALNNKKKIISIENARPYVETTARYELVTVCRTQTKPRIDVGGRGEMVGEVYRGA